MTDLDIFLRDLPGVLEQVGICLGLVIIEKLLERYQPKRKRLAA